MSDDAIDDLSRLRKTIFDVQALGNGAVHLGVDWSQIEEEERRQKEQFPSDEEFGNIVNQQQQQINELTISHYPHPTVPSNIANYTSLRNLKGLVVDNALFESLPLVIGNLIKLEYLKISACASLIEIPQPIFEGLQSLRGLHISSCNRFNTLPWSIGQLSSMETIIIQKCPIRALPLSVGHLSKLKSLALYNTQIRVLPNELCNLVNLQRLLISKNLDSRMLGFSVFDVIKKIPNLEEFYLHACYHFINSLPLLPRLKMLGLHVIRCTQESDEQTISQLTIFDENLWKEGSSMEHLKITGLQRSNGRLLKGLPSNLRHLILRRCKVNNLLHVLENEALPQGLLELDLTNCSSTSYSTSEKIDCIESLAKKYVRLSMISIRDEETIPFPISPQPPLPLKEMYLMKFNQCGRVLLHRSNNKGEGTTTKPSKKPLKPLGLSVWPTVLAKVHDAVHQQIVYEGLVGSSIQDIPHYSPNQNEELLEIEASILFQFLQGPAFLGRS